MFVCIVSIAPVRHSFVKVCFSLVYLPCSWGTSFNKSRNADQLEMNSLKSLFLWKSLDFFPSLLKYIFARFWLFSCSGFPAPRSLCPFQHVKCVVANMSSGSHYLPFIPYLSSTQVICLQKFECHVPWRGILF